MTTTKLTVELEFDDPVFVEIFDEIAKRWGVSLGRFMAKELQVMTNNYGDPWGGEFMAWVDRKMAGKEHLQHPQGIPDDWKAPKSAEVSE
jgi:hypothetical protein